jgi:hypothetical protein
MRWLKQYPWYTLLIAVYSPMALIAFNVGQVQFDAVFRSLLITLVSVFLLTTLVMLLVRDGRKAGLIVSVFLILFFSYGHVYDVIAKLNIGGILIGRHRYLMVLYLLALLGVILWVLRSKSSFSQSALVLTTIAVVALFFPLYQLIMYQIKVRPAVSTASAASAAAKVPANEKMPDVYYIILDTYGRTDILKKYAGYDNTPFIEGLEKLGFYVAKCSQSNYSQTGLSLASSLNYNYLDAMGVDFSKPGSNREDVQAPYIKHNAVAQQFRNLGYKVVAFKTGFDFSTLDDADVLYPAPESGISDFEHTLIRTTALVLLDDAGTFKDFYPNAAKNRREMVLFQFKTLENLPSMPGPKFVFAHMLVPHWPFVFGPNGESLIGSNFVENSKGADTKEYFAAYRDQSIFTSNQILQVVSEIIKNSDPAPVIIIQGDHGPNHAGDAARIAILNAYYFPDGKTQALYPKITPVNSFPVVFNTYLGGNFQLLPDKSYYSSYNDPDNTNVIENDCVAP